MKINPLGGSWIPARLVISAIAVGVAALLGFSVYKLWERLERRDGSNAGERPDVGERLPSLPELNEIMRVINSQLSTAQISEVGVIVEGDAPSARFTIASDHPNYYFESMMYTIETGGDVRKIPTAGLCHLIDRIERKRHSRVLEALDGINVEVELGPAGAALKAAGPARAIFEVLYALRGITKVPRKRARILVKGYADNQKLNWERSLMAQPYYFDRIPVLLPDRKSLNEAFFLAQSSFVIVPDPYKNEHLPDLRAAFFKQDFIEPFFKVCDAADNVEIFILKGYEFARHDPRERRVDVQVDLF